MYSNSGKSFPHLPRPKCLGPRLIFFIKYILNVIEDEFNSIGFDECSTYCG